MCFSFYSYNLFSVSAPDNVLLVGGEGSKQSRLEQDFAIISWIGRGGFGDVIQVTQPK